MFLRLGLEELDSYSIHPKWHLISDHAPLTVTIPIFKEYIQTKKYNIVKDSKKEKNFGAELIEAIRGIKTNDISDVDFLENVV